MVWGAGLLRSHDIASTQCAGFVRRGNRRLALVHRSPQLLITSRGLPVLDLCRHRWIMPFARRRFLLRSGTRLHASRTAVIAHAVCVIVHNGLVVDVVNHRDIHIVDGSVVIEVVMVPPSAHIAGTEISEAIIDTAIKTD